MTVIGGLCARIRESLVPVNIPKGRVRTVAYGAQDIYLTGNPSITFWKTVYRRYTSFALESIEQTFNGTVDFGKKISCTISRNGDLVSTMFLEVTMKKAATASYYPAENFVKEVELEIGGQRIDKHYADWFRIYDELFRTGDEKLAYRRMVDFDRPAAAQDTAVTKRFYVPLIFFFNKTPGLALPLIALQYHEVKLNFTLASAAEMALNGVDTTSTPTAALYVTYVFLDTDERRRYAQTSHEFLITQLQHTGPETLAPGASARTTNVRLNYNHPTRFLAWAVKGTNHGEFTLRNRGEVSDKFAPLKAVKLQLNGLDRFSERRGSYFSQVQPYEHLKARPGAGVYMYNFGLRPDETQPSGSCNLSRIDNATLVVTTKAGSVGLTGDVEANIVTEDDTLANISGNLTNLLVFAENFNVLRVMSGIISGHYPNNITSGNCQNHLSPTASCHRELRAFASVGKQCNYPAVLMC